ncbi:major facilitator superfamily domain-containing protein [Chytriomyces sp. MP71]|nr:major facilitator superfamily domain-containing protein [Chytriomyces sp. MP71]
MFRFPTAHLLKLARQCTFSFQWLLYLSAALLSICNFVFINATQSLVLSHVLRIPHDELGGLSGSLSFCDQVFSLLSVWLSGVASDLVGRRLVYSFGFATMAAALSLYPRAHSVTVLFLLRALFALGGGAGAAMLTAVLADYAKDDNRGMLAGLVGLCSGSGALVALFAFMPLPFKFSDIVQGVEATYLIVGIISFAFSILLALFLVPVHPSIRNSCEAPNPAAGTGNIVHPSALESRTDEESILETASRANSLDETRASAHLLPPSLSSTSVTPATAKKSIAQIAREGFLAARDPRVLLGYTASFLARGDTVIITLFIPLWVYRRYIELGQCAAPSPEDPDIRDVCAAAYRRASAISGIAQTAALVGAPLFGYLADRLHASTVVVFNALLGFVFYVVLFFADPVLGYVFGVVVFVGLSEIGLVIGSMSLVTSNASVDASIRGSVAGVASACGAIGILVSSKVGGYLFDNWREGAPFLVLAVGHGLALLYGFYAVARMRSTYQ